MWNDFGNIKLVNRHVFTNSNGSNILVYSGQLLEKCVVETVLAVFCSKRYWLFFGHNLESAIVEFSGFTGKDIYYSVRNIVRYKSVPAQYDLICKDVNLMSF